MVYLSPLYSTSLLPATTYFVKPWKDPRFCILSADEEEELMVCVNRMGRFVNPMAKKDLRKPYFGIAKRKHPEVAETKQGKWPVYYILSISGANKAQEEGAIPTSETGQYLEKPVTIPLVLEEGQRPCQGKLGNGDACPHPASRGRDYCNVCQEKTAIAGKIYTRARYKNVLPERLAELYEEALSRPDLMELENQVAVLDAKLMVDFEETKKNPVPTWEEVGRVVAYLRDPDLHDAAVGTLEEYVKRGCYVDSRWQEIRATMEQQRKMVDTEVKRKKELNLMIPIDRVMVLMGSIADVIKRHVRDPAALKQLKKEMSSLLNAQAGGRQALQIERGEIITVEDSSASARDFVG